MRRTLALTVLFTSTLALAAPAPTSRRSSAPLLPTSLPGFTQTSAPSSAPDSAMAPVLHEYGLAQSTVATYAAGPRQLTIHAYRFADATGAYGTFTFLRQPGMHPDAIGHEGASSGDHYFFWNGATVIDATFAQSSSDEKSVLAALVSHIPRVGGAAGIPPSLPHYLPSALLDATSVKYVIGPLAYASIGGELPASAIDFGLDTEVVTAHYGPEGQLTLLLYPTPQIAGAHRKAIDALAGSSAFSTKRSGPLVAIVSGSVSPQKAQQLLAQIRFNDYVTIDHPEGYVPETVKLYRLLMGVTMMVVVLVCAALFLGLFFGGGRAVVRILRGKPPSTLSDEEFISLHLGG